jgi:hypothetical protein
MSDDKCPTDWQRLFGLAAYELTTPVAVVSGYARVLQSGKTDAWGEKQQKIFADLDRAAERAREVTEKMRLLQAFEAGQRWTTVEKTEISLESVIREAIATPGRRWDPLVAVDVLINPGETAVMAHAEPLKRAVVALVSWVCGELGRKQRYRMHIRIADSPEPSRDIVVAETAASHVPQSCQTRTWNVSTTTRTPPVSTCRWLHERSRRMEVESGGSKAPLVCASHCRCVDPLATARM